MLNARRICIVICDVLSSCSFSWLLKLYVFILLAFICFNWREESLILFSIYSRRRRSMRSSKDFLLLLLCTREFAGNHADVVASSSHGTTLCYVWIHTDLSSANTRIPFTFQRRATTTAWASHHGWAMIRISYIELWTLPLLPMQFARKSLLKRLLLLHRRALLQTASQRAIQVSLCSIRLLSIEELVLILRRLLINLRISIDAWQHSILITLNTNLIYPFLAIGTHVYIVG